MRTVCSALSSTRSMWRPLKRRGPCRPVWRRAAVALLAVAAVVAVLTEMMDDGTESEKHFIGKPIYKNTMAVRHQEAVIYNQERTGSSEKEHKSRVKTTKSLENVVSDEHYPNGRYANVILSQFKEPRSYTMDAFKRSGEKDVKSNSNTFSAWLSQEEIREAEYDFSLRRKKVRDTCTKYGLGNYKTGAEEPRVALRYPPTANYDVLYIDRRDGFTYCPVYKVASTSWLHYLSQLAGADPSFLNSTSQQISTIARRLWPQLDYDEASMAVPATLKFMLVRHPFERIVSAYRDKLENINIGREHGVLHFYESYGKKIVQKYRKDNFVVKRVRLDENADLPAPSGVEPTFQEFVRYLIDIDLVHYADDHWMPYYLYCTPCFIHYDVIAHFDSLERDQKYILQKLNLNKNWQRPQWKHLTKGKKTSVIVEKYLNTLSKMEKHKLYEKYKIDFEMFDFQIQLK